MKQSSILLINLFILSHTSTYAQEDTSTLDVTIKMINIIFKESGVDKATQSFQLTRDGKVSRKEIVGDYTKTYTFWIQDVDLNLEIFDHYQNDDGVYEVTIDCKSPGQCIEYVYQIKDEKPSYEYDRSLSIKLHKKEAMENLYNAFIFFSEMTE